MQHPFCHSLAAPCCTVRRLHLFRGDCDRFDLSPIYGPRRCVTSAYFL